MKLRDTLWLWGHGRQSENITGLPLNLRGRPGISNVSTPEAARIMGIPNICRISFNPTERPPFDEELEVSGDMQKIVWSVLGCGEMKCRDDTDEVVRLARKYPNIVGGIMDDFFPGANPEKAKIFTPQVLQQMRRRLHQEAGRELGLWVVVYEWDLREEPYKIKSHLDVCDVATLWTYQAERLSCLEDTYQKMRAVWGEERPLLAGCYMWDFPGRKPIPQELMEFQLDTYYRWLKEGKIDGLILCHNWLVDLDIQAVQYTKKWIEKYGGTEIDTERNI